MKCCARNVLVFGAGFLACALLAAVIPLAVLGLGLMDMSASAKPGLLEKTLAPWAVDRSMERRAPDAKNTFADDPAALPSGMALYKENCVQCHGAPHLDAAAFAAGLNPPAPYLEEPDTQSFSDGQLFWTIKNGIRMTGMAAFGSSRTDEEIWHIVAYVRHLPKLTDAEQKALHL
jgi:mono/diheme cytochrome c family protein